MDIKDLTTKASEYLPRESVSRIEEACRFALDAGHPDLDRALEVAMILAGFRMDAPGITAAILQSVPSGDTDITTSIQKNFGDDVANLVNDVNKVSSISWYSPDEVQAENLRKMFLALAEDIRVVIISLANRLEVMRTIKKLSPRERKPLAEETMEIYVPLAQRLGIGGMRSELEDIAFRNLYPDEYKEISKLLDVRKTEWERYIAHATRVLKEEFKKAGLKAEITGRPKSVYSIYNKMEVYDRQGKESTDIYDLLALRVLVDKVSDCYSALGIIHGLWHPLAGQFDDYIANPKGNMYQSLHTVVIAVEGKPLEIQIRTHEMHRTNEYGIAAHWRYKEGETKDLRFEEKLSLFRQLVSWQQDLTGTGFIESLKTDIFRDQVYVFTPKGEIRELPRGSTPLDFAYRIHTDLGHRCTGAKVNGKLVQLAYQLKDGDVVDILSAKYGKGPSLDWLNPELGYVKSHQAKEKIKQWFRRQERAENLDRGKNLLEKELKRLSLGFSEEEIAELFGYDDVNEFMIAIGCGEVNIHQLGAKLVPKEEPRTQDSRLAQGPSAPKQAEPAEGVQVLGAEDLLTNLAPCCTPIPGDHIIGYVTRNKGVTVHRRDCPNIAKVDDPQRLVEVSWGALKGSYPVSIAVRAQDRVGLIKDITSVVSEAKINIVAISNTDHEDGSTTIFLTVDITDMGHLGRLFSKLGGIEGVVNVSRTGYSKG
ncbi:MAG: RelA/SpoT family protein [Dehalococcoidia bacterium]